MRRLPGGTTPQIPACVTYKHRAWRHWNSVWKLQLPRNHPTMIASLGERRRIFERGNLRDDGVVVVLEGGDHIIAGAIPLLVACLGHEWREHLPLGGAASPVTVTHAT
jgi:hypothetical protein